MTTKTRIKTPSERITFNNVLATLFVIGFFAFLFYYAESSKVSGSVLAQDPVLNILLGMLGTSLGTIIIFYFRTGPPDPTVDEDGDGIPDTK